MTECEIAQKRVMLAEAERAYHSLMIGGGVAELRDGLNGDLVRYTPANAFRLMAYINSLRAELGMSTKGAGKPGIVWF